MLLFDVGSVCGLIVAYRWRAMLSVASIVAMLCCGLSAACAASRPNVILIMTDDQGWGDVGFHGNPVLNTPNLDALAKQSLELTRFHVCPVCSPTRASLMTGRYNYRTGAIDTYLGRSTMVAEEVTLAEMFGEAGYHTGIFGKWHLGDNYPSRPNDQGFEESLVHRGGGMVQPADPPGGSYFDPILVHNGQNEQTRGYCTDVFTDAAIRFVERCGDEPFFVYLPYNCPHTPLEVPESYLERYQNKGLNDATARIYGMVANIDDNVGKLLARLATLELDDNTIVIFITDNGPQQDRYNGPLRQRKGSVYDGGIRVPCLIRWPGHFEAGATNDQVAAHIDLAPTLLAVCGIETPQGVRFDGVNLLDVLTGKQERLDDRYLFFQWHRGDEPVRYRACAVRGPRFKLLQAEGRGPKSDFSPRWELFDVQADPGESTNLAEKHPDVVKKMKAAYDRWFDDVSATRGYPVPRILAGTKHENPVTLTRQDWRGPQADWGKLGLGHWDVDFTAGRYDVTVRMPALEQASPVTLQIGQIEKTAPAEAGEERVVFRDVEIPAGTQRVAAVVTHDGKQVGAHYVDLDAAATNRAD